MGAYWTPSSRKGIGFNSVITPKLSIAALSEKVAFEDSIFRPSAVRVDQPINRCNLFQGI